MRPESLEDRKPVHSPEKGTKTPDVPSLPNGSFWSPKRIQEAVEAVFALNEA